MLPPSEPQVRPVSIVSIEPVQQVSNVVVIDNGDDVDVDDEHNSGENDVEYAEFSMAYRMPAGRHETASSNLLSAPSNDSITMSDELMLLTLLDHTPVSNSVPTGGSKTSGRHGSKYCGWLCSRYEAILIYLKFTHVKYI